MHTVALSLASLPLANVRLPARAFPDTIAMFNTHVPLAVVHFAILPHVNTFAVGLSSLICSMKSVPSHKDLKAVAIALVREPLSFIYTSGLVDENAATLALTSFIELAAIYTAIFVLFDAESFAFAHLFIVKLVTKHLILFDCLAFILELTIFSA